MKYWFTYSTRIGAISIKEENDAIVGLGFDRNESYEDWKYQETELLSEAAAQVLDYLAGKRQTFTVAVRTHGTPFQEKVWEKLREIPYGETRTYGQLAAAAGSPKGARAAGMACHCNPVMILIPCHRIIGSNGSLTGFGGGLAAKKELLAVEGQYPPLA